MKPAVKIKSRTAYYTGGFVLTAILGVLATQTGTTQQIFDPPGVVLDYRCPAYALPSNTPITMRAAIVGAKKLLDEKQVKNILFNWELSDRKLLTGQGTRNALIDPSGFSRINVKLRVEGAPPYMEREKTCELEIDPNCNPPVLFDEYGGVSNEEERQHLDRFAAHFRDTTPKATAYIISYAGRNACYDEGKWRADQLLEQINSIQRGLFVRQTRFRKVLSAKPGRFCILGGGEGEEGFWTDIIVQTSNGLWVNELDRIPIFDAVFLSDKHMIASGIEIEQHNKSSANRTPTRGVILFSSNSGETWSLIHRSPASEKFIFVGKASKNTCHLGYRFVRKVWLEIKEQKTIRGAADPTCQTCYLDRESSVTS